MKPIKPQKRNKRRDFAFLSSLHSIIEIARKLRAILTANAREWTLIKKFAFISVHSRLNCRIEPGAALFGAKNDMEYDLAQGLGHIGFQTVAE